MWRCRTCGIHKEREMFCIHLGCRDGIDTGRCKACKSAYEKHRRATVDTRHQDVLNRAKTRAKKKGVPFDISLEDIEIPIHCPVFGTPFNGDISVDRMEPNKGYVKGNVNMISLRANVVKGNATLEELEAVVAWMKSKK